jgi:allophanate hydrolase
LLSQLPFTLSSLHKAYAEGVSVTDVMAEVDRRISGVNDPGIFISRTSSSERAIAVAALDEFNPKQKPLWGIPFVVKDNIDVAGLPTTAGCPEFAYTPSENAFAVQLLINAGAVVIGKTNLDQFATGLVGVRTPYPIPRNALESGMVPGGSSSGSAVAVAHGLVSFSLGTDTAGSGRVPAGLNNIVGLKPSLGAISATGVVPACRSLDTISIFALTVSDANEVFRTAAQFDSHDVYSRQFTTGKPIKTPTSFTVAIPDSSSLIIDEPAQKISFDATIEQLIKMGATVTPIDFTPFYEAAKLLYEGPWVAERHAATESFLKKNAKAMFPVTRTIIEQALSFSATDAFNAQYRLNALKRDVAPFLSACDFLCVPTFPGFCSLKAVEQEPVAANARLGTYTNFVNLMDLCGITVPTSTRDDGRPGSVTLIAQSGEDAYVAGIADALHRQANANFGATNWQEFGSSEHLPLTTENETAITAVGAHMRDLPLNHQLTNLGARFLYATKTAPEYKLIRLQGGPPLRPGLIRQTEGTEIELEVWAIPSKNVGAFISQIPSPLGIGKVKLNSGEHVLGFICEAIGKLESQDITEFGGWRNYIASQSN